jgi:hypothetical protein
MGAGLDEARAAFDCGMEDPAVFGRQAHGKDLEPNAEGRPGFDKGAFESSLASGVKEQKVTPANVPNVLRPSIDEDVIMDLFAIVLVLNHGMVNPRGRPLDKVPIGIFLHHPPELVVLKLGCGVNFRFIHF